MLALTLGRRDVNTIFDLLGTTENDLTYSLGWALASSPELLAALVERVGGGDDPGSALAIALQAPAETGGYTDIELRFPRLHMIVEAKRGWFLPDISQLTKYRPRFTDPAEGVLLVLSEASPSYAALHLPEEVDGVPVCYLSWPELIALAEHSADQAGAHAETRLVRELARYLRGAVRMQDPFSTLTYCVAISQDMPNGGSLSFRQVVDNGFYFHPFGKNWPKVAPSFLAFRWAGAVQRIHHVDSYRIVDSLNAAFSEIPLDEGDTDPYIVYTLGPSLGPPTPLPSGATYRANRMWVAVDLLLTSPTLKEAVAETKKRQQAIG